MKTNKTKRKYVGRVYKSKISMVEAVQDLSPNSFKFLNLIYHEVLKGEELVDTNIMAVLGVSRRPYFRAKDELKEKGYIRIVQVASTKYKWYVGKKAIAKDAKRYDKGRKLKADREFANLVLGIKVERDEYIDNPTEGVFVLEGFEQGFDNEIAV